MEIMQPNTEERIFAVDTPVTPLIVQCTKQCEVKFWFCGIILPSMDMPNDFFFDFDKPRNYSFYVSDDYVLLDKVAENVAKYVNCDVQQLTIIEDSDLTFTPCN